jgi:anaerobic magnesium-protoporphyrin IX monomethyl ester cyclase
MDASRICLIIPPSSFLIDDRVFPSLGVLKVAAELESRGVQVSVLDLSGIVDFREPLERQIREDNTLVYGITATMPQMPAAASIARTIRRDKPKAKLILGGPHATLVRASQREEVRKGQGLGRASTMMLDLHALFDTVVAGDGEKAIWEAIKPDAPSLIDGDDVKSPLFLTGDDLNEAQFPARHLIDIESYRYEIDGVPTQSLIAQLGCPFKCGFCGGRRSPFLRKIRQRDSDAVVSEMKHLYEQYGTRGFMFLDDELNVNRSFMELLEKIVTLQKSIGVEFRCRGLLKSELVTEPMADAMYRAGFRQVLIGFESGSPRILHNIQKQATVEENTRCVNILRTAGIRVKALMSLGHPGDTEETVRATRDWLVQVQPSDFDVTIITVYPGTPYFDDAEQTSADVWTYRSPKTKDALHMLPVDHMTDVNFYKGRPKDYRAYVFTDTLSTERIAELRDETEEDVRRLLSIPYPKSSAELQFEHSMGAR